MNKKHTMDWRGLCPIAQRPHPRLTPQDFQPCITAYYAAISSPLKLQRGETTGTYAHFAYAERLSRKSNRRLVTLTSLTPESKSRLNKLRSG